MYHTRDSLYMSLWNVISGEYHRRYWAGAWSKRTSCQCGCQGRCTFASVWRFWIWVSTIWKCCLYPSVRDDGVPFSESKKGRRPSQGAMGRTRTSNTMQGRCCAETRGLGLAQTVCRSDGMEGRGASTKVLLQVQSKQKQHPVYRPLVKCNLAWNVNNPPNIYSTPTFVGWICFRTLGHLRPEA